MNVKDFAVSVKDLDVKFGDFFAVKKISFDVRPGEIFGFLGANGAGKTTTIRVLCGLLAPTNGNVRVAGENYGGLGAALKMKVGYMSQRFTLYEDLTVLENLTLAAELHHMTPKRANERRKELLDFIGWTRPLNFIVKDLPGGQKQQVSLVAALMHDPEIIFLDEPTAGVSPAARLLFWNLIRKLSAQGKTVFVTTHYMDEAEYCGRIALMRAGELVALDSPSELKILTFPRGLIELEPKRALTNFEVTEIKNSGYFDLFEPYGLRFHAEWKNKEIAKQKSAWLENLMTSKQIPPSLEDVFIRIVEGRDR